MSKLAGALFTKTQQKVLALIYTRPDKSFYTKEIIRNTGMGVATIKRELDRMVSAGILSMEKIGNQHHYKANAECPIYHELFEITKKTMGVAGTLSQALSLLGGNIEWAFIFGSVAGGKESSFSDIDLMIIGNVGYADAVNALYDAQESLGREINPKIYSKEEWLQMKKTDNAFVGDVLSKPRINVMGKEYGVG